MSKIEFLKNLENILDDIKDMNQFPNHNKFREFVIKEANKLSDTEITNLEKVEYLYDWVELNISKFYETIPMEEIFDEDLPLN
ncbi:hypothetical protein [Oceanivirga miroungae]|uniref:Uncharacterized protein n=1 Tax=Oceanivirga miroungae TaxID=1130046 RepID=A0A6I8M9V4_9FUSO|nr:hypothetical protein [Oceanivirga miroungae]VWL85087.1 hypothetical protein OMES3154_00369 [Oceanivirga miroungae]